MAQREIPITKCIWCKKNDAPVYPHCEECIRTGAFYPERSREKARQIEITAPQVVAKEHRMTNELRCPKCWEELSCTADDIEVDMNGNSTLDGSKRTREMWCDTCGWRS